MGIPDGYEAFRVEISADIIVLARDAQAAEDCAQECVLDLSDQMNFCAEAWEPGDVLPEGWTEECLVYGDHEGDVSVADLLKGASDAQGED